MITISRYRDLSCSSFFFPGERRVPLFFGSRNSDRLFRSFLIPLFGINVLMTRHVCWRFDDNHLRVHLARSLRYLVCIISEEKKNKKERKIWDSVPQTSIQSLFVIYRAGFDGRLCNKKKIIYIIKETTRENAESEFPPILYTYVLRIHVCKSASPPSWTFDKI